MRWEIRRGGSAGGERAGDTTDKQRNDGWRANRGSNGKIDGAANYGVEKAICLRNDGAEARYLHSRSQALTFTTHNLQILGERWQVAD